MLLKHWKRTKSFGKYRHRTAHIRRLQKTFWQTRKIYVKIYNISFGRKKLMKKHITLLITGYLYAGFNLELKDVMKDSLQRSNIDQKTEFFTPNINRFCPLSENPFKELVDRFFLHNLDSTRQFCEFLMSFEFFSWFNFDFSSKTHYS